jgi:hypothetical protein
MTFQLKLLKAFSLGLILLMVVYFVLAILGKLAWTAFFLLSALVALCAYVFIPKIRARLEKK